MDHLEIHFFANIQYLYGRKLLCRPIFVKFECIEIDFVPPSEDF